MGVWKGRTVSSFWGLDNLRYRDKFGHFSPQNSYQDGLLILSSVVQKFLGHPQSLQAKSIGGQ